MTKEQSGENYMIIVKGPVGSQYGITVGLILKEKKNERKKKISSTWLYIYKVVKSTWLSLMDPLDPFDWFSRFCCFCSIQLLNSFIIHVLIFLLLVEGNDFLFFIFCLEGEGNE